MKSSNRKMSNAGALFGVVNRAKDLSVVNEKEKLAYASIK